ncbi:MAG: AIR synthase-related protein, partial [Nanoarchaeota archaeon]|nr:AIR synthase-related protein [Nanoarchaeota archaeon]
TAVQIGDPYTQRKLFEALLEARDKGIINFITDLGAGGVSCAALEMAEETNGLDINLDKLLVKYEGMTATELFLNESQERMAIALNPKYAAQFEEILKKHEVEYSDIGSFTNSGRAIVKSKDEVVVDMDMHFINNGFPKRTLNPKEYRLNEEYAANLELLFELRRNNVYIKNIEGNKFAKHEFYEMHKRPNLASIASFMDKMDSTVKGLSVQHCIQGKGRVSGRASCTLPDTESKEALIQAYGHAERQSYIDAERMGINSFLRSIGNNIAMGGRLDYMVATDQALWQNSDKPEYQQMLIEGNRGLSKVIEGCEVPVISGKDSMYNQAKIYDKNGNVVERGVFPTILMTTLSKIDDVDKLVTIDAKNEGDVIYIIGSKTKADMGGSEFMNMYSEKHNVEFHIGKTSDEKISEVYETFKKINKAADEQLLQSAIYVESGGIMIALRDMAMSGEIGIKADLSKVHHDYKIEQHELMYGETEGRFIVTVKPQDCEKFEKSVGLFADKSSNSEYGCRKIGFVGGKTLDIEHNNRTILSEKVDDILATYHQKTEEQPKIAA